MTDMTMLALAFFIKSIEERHSKGWVEYAFLDVAALLIATPCTRIPYLGDFSKRFKTHVAKLERKNR